MAGARAGAGAAGAAGATGMTSIGGAGRSAAGGTGGSGGAGATGGANGGAMLCTPSGDCEEELAVPNANHMAGNIDYPDAPPVGGTHNPNWAAWGVHAEPVPDECWVHNLEHGGVVVLYNCPEGCAEDVAQLEAFVADHRRTLLTEYPEMPKRYAAVSWGHRLSMDTLDLDSLNTFYTLHFDMAPESLDNPPQGSCP
jgi:hypothetical protein